MHVQAEDEKHAISLTRRNPYGYAQGFSHYVGYEIIDANEED